MKLAIVGSRECRTTSIGYYVSSEVTEIVSGGAKGIDQCAREYAQATGLKLTEFLPDYARYHRAAPLRRNEQIVAYADAALVFWDGSSAGTKHIIDLCKQQGKPCMIIYTCKT